MNLQHLRAFLWLRWRLFANQATRGGTANQVILAIFAVAFVPGLLFLFIFAFCMGAFGLPEFTPTAFMYGWDVLMMAFLFFWSTGLLATLQRSEALSLDKFLHLPVSLTGVFVLNYLSSLFSLNLALFVPAVVGFSLGLAFSQGPEMLLLLPLLASFLLMVTALTYQLQSWLASLMVNKRTRRTIIVFFTMGFILIFQLPNLINFLQPWKANRLSQEQQREMLVLLEKIVRIANMVFPPGWLPCGARSIAEGEWVIAPACILGMALIGAASLWRAYRTNVRLYTGDFTAGKAQTAAVATVPHSSPRDRGNLLEMKLPWLSEQAAVIALGGFRSLLRAPEAKFLLMTPFFLLMVFGGLLFQGVPEGFPEEALPLLPFGAISMILLTMIQLVGNQFGFDRSGFRVFVLGPAPRREILLGKNLAVVPFVVVMGLLVTGALQIVFPLRLDRFLAVLTQMISMYLVLCMMANWLSILAPMPIATGALKPVNPKLTQILIQMFFLALLPLALAPILLPVGIEALLGALGWIAWFPTNLTLSLAQCVFAIWLYRLLLSWQGDLLQKREKSILEIVTTKDE